MGWALLEINSEGVIECATENVIDVLHYSRDELNGQSIYSYLHTGDHSKVSPILDKNSFLLEWDQDDGPVSILMKLFSRYFTKNYFILDVPTNP